MSERVTRYDRRSSSLKPPKRMDNGFLRVEGRIARVGVQEYQRADGTIHRELRLPEEVFHPDSMASFVQLPVTNCHPPGMLTAKNAKKYSVGSVGEDVRQDGDYIAAPLMITDSEAIEAAEKGRSQLSNGYSCILDETQDPALTEKYGAYDSIQRNIRGNHVAIVDVARAGPEASLRLDSTDAVAIEYEKSEVKDETEIMKMPHKFTMDGLTIEVADANAQAIIERAVNAQRERADAADKLVSERDKKITSLSADLDVARAQLKDHAECGAKMDAKVREGLKEISVLVAEAAKRGADVSKIDSADPTDYRKAVIVKLLPGMKASLEGKDAAYVSAVYDSALVAVSQLPSAFDLARAGATNVVNADELPSRTAEEARQRMIERNRAMLVK